MNISSERFSFDGIEKIHTELEEVLKLRLHRSNQVVIFPTLENETINYDGIQFSKKKNDILVLILIYHFSEFFGIFSEYVRYEIEVYLYRNLIAPELVASLVDKRICLEVLLNLHYGPRVIFSLISEMNIRRVLGDLHLRIEHPRPVKRPVYRRGYNDKGSLRAETSVRPEPDVSEQLHLEKQRQLYSDCVELIVHEVGGWVLQDLTRNLKKKIRKEEISNGTKSSF